MRVQNWCARPEGELNLGGFHTYREVPREVSKDNYVILEPAEIEAVKLTSTKQIVDVGLL